MDREEALEKLQSLKGQDLRLLAEELDVPVQTEKGTLNKGWAGHTVERYLGLPINSSKSPNLGSWELKVVPLKRLKNGTLKVKETMAIGMIDPVEVACKEFENSHVYTKLRKIIAVSRIREDDYESCSICKDVNAFELEGTELFQVVKDDYEKIRSIIETEGKDALSGKIGQLIQPRTKGPGHGSKSRAFYARRCLVEYVLGWKQSPLVATRKPSLDCAEHAGKSNLNNREQLDTMIARLPPNQSGVGRHRCAYCAYKMGYADALAEMGR